MPLSSEQCSRLFDTLQLQICCLDFHNNIEWLISNSKELPNILFDILPRFGLNRESIFQNRLKFVFIENGQSFEVNLDLESCHISVHKQSSEFLWPSQKQKFEFELKDAIKTGRLCLYRQPIVCSHSHKPVRFECLSRLITKNGKLAMPDDYIPFAESAGLISLLDISTVKLALCALQNNPDLELAINISAATIADNSARREIIDLIEFSPLKANGLTIEITETTAIQDINIAAEFTHDLKDNFARIALDDFGSGYTSYKSLQELAVDEVKIDGNYVKQIHKNQKSRAVVESIQLLCRALGFETVAEQVETQQEVEILRKIGINNLQGYLFGAPAPAFA